MTIMGNKPRYTNIILSFVLLGLIINIGYNLFSNYITDFINENASYNSKIRFLADLFVFTLLVGLLFSKGKLRKPDFQVNTAVYRIFIILVTAFYLMYNMYIFMLLFYPSVVAVCFGIIILTLFFLFARYGRSNYRILEGNISSPAIDEMLFILCKSLVAVIIIFDVYIHMLMFLTYDPPVPGMIDTLHSPKNYIMLPASWLVYGILLWLVKGYAGKTLAGALTYSSIYRFLIALCAFAAISIIIRRLRYFITFGDYYLKEFMQIAGILAIAAVLHFIAKSNKVISIRMFIQICVVTASVISFLINGFTMYTWGSESTLTHIISYILQLCITVAVIVFRNTLSSALVNNSITKKN